MHPVGVNNSCRSRLTGETVIAKTAIFISHATPQDNDVVRWLGARLEVAGYEVWFT